MLLPELIHEIEARAPVLTEDLMADLRRDPHAAYLHRVDERTFRSRALDLYTNLSRWIADRREEEVERAYGELGRTRCREGVPASELVYALIRAKAHLFEYIRRNAEAGSAVDLYQEDELLGMIGRFFDRAIYHALRGYESVQRGTRGT